MPGFEKRPSELSQRSAAPAPSVNIRPCGLCGAVPGEKHDQACGYPDVMAIALDHLCEVRPRDHSERELRLAASFTTCNRKALREWIRAGRPM